MILLDCDQWSINTYTLFDTTIFQEKKEVISTLQF